MFLNNIFSIKYAFYFIILLLSIWQFGSGATIFAKAQLAQLLLEKAWNRTLHDQAHTKPWDWADTHPIAKITFKGFKKELIILAGGNGNTMAFGPGHVSESPLPGNGGNSVIVGHRDTHFSILENLIINDEIFLQTLKRKLNYRITDIFIVDRNQTQVMQDDGIEKLTLITCYPFEALQTGGPLRYVVQAELI